MKNLIDDIMELMCEDDLQINNPRKAHRFSRGMDSGFIYFFNKYS